MKASGPAEDGTPPAELSAGERTGARHGPRETRNFLYIVYDEGRGVLREWLTRDEIPLGLYIIGTIAVAPAAFIAFTMRVGRRLFGR